MIALRISLLVVCSYLWGNINWAVFISKMLGKDIRTLGSGNPGTMNMIRNFGKVIGAITLIMDVIKGIVPALIGWWLLGEDQFLMLGSDRIGLYIAGVAAVFGHILPVFFKFKGGKGVATIIGVSVTAQPIVTLVCFAIGVAFLFATKIGSVVSFLIIFVPLGFEGYYAVGHSSVAGSILVFCLFLLTLSAHYKNILKLFSGTEGRVKLKHSKPVPKEVK